MGVIAFNPMLKAGYDVKLAAGVITAGGTLGILIPPSVMIIVYAAVAGQSVVKLYAAAMFPGFFLAFLYLVYIVGWAMINPKIAPPLPEEQTRVPVPDWMREVPGGLFAQHVLLRCCRRCSRRQGHGDRRRRQGRIGYWMLVKNLPRRWCRSSWSPARSVAGLVVRRHSSAGGGARRRSRACSSSARRLQRRRTPADRGPPTHFYCWFCGHRRWSARVLMIALLLADSTPSGSRSSSC